MSTKNCQALTAACNSAADVLKKAHDSGLATHAKVLITKDQLDKVESKRKDCASALSYVAKNPKCKLEKFAWDQAECTQDLKDLALYVKDLRKWITDFKKEVAAEAAKAKAGA